MSVNYASNSPLVYFEPFILNFIKLFEMSVLNTIKHFVVKTAKTAICRAIAELNVLALNLINREV